MSIYAVANLKGGVGKTTLVSNLAIALSLAGREVFVIDAEGTAAAFTELRTQAKGTPGYTAAIIKGPAIRTHVRQIASKYSDIVIDIGGEDATGSLRAALVVADTVLVPVKPRTFELWRTEATAALITEAREVNEGLRAVALLNEVDARGKDNAAALEALHGMPAFEVAPFVLHRWIAFSDATAAGLSVIELRGKPKAADELRTLIDFLTKPQRVSHDHGELYNGYSKESA